MPISSPNAPPQERRSRYTEAPVGGLGKTPRHTQVYGLQGGIERTYKGVERLVDVVTKVLMDRTVLPPYLGDDVTYVGFETFRPLLGAACHFFFEMVDLVRQVMFQVIHCG